MTTTTESLRDRAIAYFEETQERSRLKKEQGQRKARDANRAAFQQAVMDFAGVDGFGIKHIDYPDGRYYIEVGGGVRFSWDRWMLHTIMPCSKCEKGEVAVEGPKDMYDLGRILNYEGYVCQSCSVALNGAEKAERDERRKQEVRPPSHAEQLAAVLEKMIDARVNR